MIRRLLGAGLVLGAMALSAVGFCAWSYGREMRIDPATGVDEAGYVKINGLRQWIQVRGDDRSKPVLLLLNGGPGFSMLGETYTFRKWERDYTLAMWDQRGEGKTFDAAPQRQGPMSIEQLADDGNAVADYLRRRLGKDKVILLGHSWGSLLGVHMVRKRPDLYLAYVGTGQLVGEQRDAMASYTPLVARAREQRNRAAERALMAAGPPPYSADPAQWVPMLLSAQAMDPASSRRAVTTPASLWLTLRQHVTRLLGPAEVAPGVTPAVRFSMNSLWPDIVRDDLLEQDLRFRVPVIMIQGAQDITTPTGVARTYFEQIEAPAKRFIVLQRTGHLALYREPDRFLAALDASVRRVAAPAG